MSRLSSFWRRSRNWPVAGQIGFAVLIGVITATMIGVLANAGRATKTAHSPATSTTSGATGPIVTAATIAATAATTAGSTAASTTVRPAPTATAAAVTAPTVTTAAPRPALLPLTIAAPTHAESYDRAADFGGFVDADHDCQDARAEVLIARSEAAVTFTSAKGCTVKTGRWTDPWSGAVRTVAHDLQIDHTVPLANAWSSGAWAWTHDERVAYANDLTDADHLVPILASENESKGDGGPERWRPPDAGSWCRYATAWDHIKAKWHLTATGAEWAALVEMAASC